MSDDQEREIAALKARIKYLEAVLRDTHAALRSQTINLQAVLPDF